MRDDQLASDMDAGGIEPPWSARYREWSLGYFRQEERPCGCPAHGLGMPCPKTRTGEME